MLSTPNPVLSSVPVEYTKDIEPVTALEREVAMLLELMAQGERDYTKGHTVSHAEARKEFQRQLAELRQSE